MKLTDAQIKHLADRFLGWRLPKDFHPDDGISAKRPNYAPSVEWAPTGTNLLTATQAEAMVRYMLEGDARRMTDTTIVVAPPAPDPKNPTGWKYRRFAVFATLAFCYAMIAYVVIDKQDTELGRLIVITLGGLAGSTLGSYVFGAAWERVRGQP